MRTVGQLVRWLEATSLKLMECANRNPSLRPDAEKSLAGYFQVIDAICEQYRQSGGVPSDDLAAFQQHIAGVLAEVPERTK